MTRNLTLLALFCLVLAGITARPTPAQAFCIANKTAFPLRIHLETPNPFGKFAELFQPGTRSCCSWFNQSCNPTRTRDGLLMFSVRSKYGTRPKLFCSSGWLRRVYVTASGNVEITEKRGTLGGLRCDSRDLSSNPVTQQTFLKRYKRGGMPPPIVVPPPPGR